MTESFVLSVDVSQKMLGALGEVEYGLKIYYLRTGSCNRRERLRQQAQVTQVQFLSVDS